GSSGKVEGTGSRLEASAAAVLAPPLTEQQHVSLLEQLRALQQQLTSVQGEHPLILPSVDYQAVASVVADWTGIPVGRMARNEIDTVMHLADILSQRVIGQ